jgi:hypothetical protein
MYYVYRVIITVYYVSLSLHDIDKLTLYMYIDPTTFINAHRIMIGRHHLKSH